MAKKRQAVTKAQIDEILKSIKPNLKASEQAKITRSNNTQRAANARTQAAITKTRATKIASSSPVPGKNATDKTKEYINSQKNIEADMLALTGEKPVKKDKSWFNKTMDFLTRGQNASAAAFRDGFDPKTKEFWEVGRATNSFKRGLAGKEPDANFGDVLKQHGHTGRGMGTLGFALDIAADPTTYMGVGLVGKAGAKGAQVARNLEKTEKIVNKVTTHNPGVKADVLKQALGSDRLPIENMSRRQVKKLSPAAQQAVATLKAERKGTNYSRKGLETARMGKVIKDSGGRTYADFSGIVDPKIRKAAETVFEQEVKTSPGLRTRMRNFKFDGTMTDAAGRAFKDGRTRLGAGYNNKEAMARIAALIPVGSKSVATQGTEEYLRRNMIHEMGHHLAYSLPKETKEEILAFVNKNSENNDVIGFLRTNLSDRAADDVRMGNKSLDETFAEAWAEHRIMGAAARPLAKRIARALEGVANDVPIDQTSRKVLDSVAEDTIREARETFTDQIRAKYVGKEVADDVVKKEVDDLMTQAGLKDADSLKVELATGMIDNLSPKVKKQLALRVGGAQLAIPGVAAALGKTATAIGSPAFVRKSLDAFNRGFRANAYIPESLRHLRTREYSMGANLIREHAHEVQSVWDAVPSAVRKDIARAWAKGENLAIEHPGGITARTNAPVENVMDELDTVMQDMHNKAIGLAESMGIYAQDLNNYLPKPFQLVDRKTSNSSHVTDSGTNLTAKSVSESQYDPNYFLDGVKANMLKGDVTDPARAIFLYQSAINMAVAKRQIWNTIGEIHGASAGQLGDTLAKQGWVPATYRGKVIAGLEDQVFEPEVAAAVSRMAEVFSSSKSTGDFIRHYDRALMGVKSVLTRYNPSFHPRTFMGEMLLGYLGGMKNLPDSYAKANRVLRGRNQEFLGDQAPTGPASRRTIQTSNVLRGVPAEDVARGGSKTVLNHSRFGALSADTLWHHYMNSGLKSGFASTDMVRGVENTLGGETLRRFSDATQRGTEAIEDVGRLAHFIDALRYSKAKTLDEAIEEAAQTVRKTHLDYTEITQMEKNVMARIIPFYKWLRLSTPLMAEILLTQPGKAIVIPKAMDFASRAAGHDPDALGVFPSGPDAAIPEYLRESGSRPVFSIGKNTQWFNPTSLVPFAGSIDLADKLTEDPLKETFDIMNPMLSSPAEWALNAQANAGPPRDDPGKFLAGQTPQTGFARKMLAPEGEQSRTELALKFLGNPGLQSNTSASIQSAAYQDRQKAIDERREAKRRAGLLEPKK